MPSQPVDTRLKSYAPPAPTFTGPTAVLLTATSRDDKLWPQDRWIEVGVDRQTGFIVLLVEHIGEAVTRHAEVTSLELDPALPDELFTVHLPEDVRRIY